MLIGNNCSASRGSPNDAEQLPEWRNFQFAQKNQYGFFYLHTIPSTIAFRLDCMLFYQFYAKITRRRKVRCGSSRRNVWRKLTWKWRQDVQNDVKIVILTSCTRVVLHLSCKTTFPSPGRVHGNPGRACKKKKSVISDHFTRKTGMKTFILNRALQNDTDKITRIFLL